MKTLHNLPDGRQKLNSIYEVLDFIERKQLDSYFKLFLGIEAQQNIPDETEKENNCETDNSSSKIEEPENFVKEELLKMENSQSEVYEHYMEDADIHEEIEEEEEMLQRTVLTEKTKNGGRKRARYTFPEVTNEFKQTLLSYALISNESERARKEVELMHNLVGTFWCVPWLIAFKEHVEERQIIGTNEEVALRKNYSTAGADKYYTLPLPKNTRPKYYGLVEWMIEDEKYIIPSRDPRSKYDGHKFIGFGLNISQ
ncbi:MAG: hypothetical protein H0W61_01195 [Bacteroidetes bacterium]|nr:hypothetical protein [Bacteroidota bacterium]